jgi:mRNA-degrading endonuclease toxin of MazEF toxin-antitoxin module
MPNTTTYKFGDVILVPFPFTDQTTSKKRPAVVVSTNAYKKCLRSQPVLSVISNAGLHRPFQIANHISTSSGKDKKEELEVATF